MGGEGGCSTSLIGLRVNSIAFWITLSLCVFSFCGAATCFSCWTCFGAWLSVSALVLDQPYPSSDPSRCREADKCISQNIRLYLYVKPTWPSAVREICMALSQMNGSTLYLQCDGFSIFRTDITRDSIRWREMIERCGARGREGGGWWVVVVNISWKNREEGRLIEQVK